MSQPFKPGSPVNICYRAAETLDRAPEEGQELEHLGRLVRVTNVEFTKDADDVLLNVWVEPIRE